MVSFMIGDGEFRVFLIEAIGNDAADFSSKQVMVPKADDENKDGEQETTKDTTDKEKVAFSEIVSTLKRVGKKSLIYPS